MNQRNGFVLPKPDDFHVHLRDGELLKRVLPDTARDFGRALVMPNLREPVWNAERLVAYRDEILVSSPPGFEPLMTIYLTKYTTPEIILQAAKAGAIAAKYYPKHGTTRSDQGLLPEELFRRDDWFAALAQAGMVLCLHGEDPRHPITRREHEFLKRFVDTGLPKRFSNLRIVIEHASTAFALSVAKLYANVAVTITVHHLMLTTDDVIGDHDCLCMPVAKSEKDRIALLEAATSGRPDVFFGSDSAPHPRSSKDRARGAYGLYTAPVALPFLAQIFQEGNRFQNLSNFVSKFGAEWYRLPEPKGSIEVVAEGRHIIDPCTTKSDSEVIRPFYAGRDIHWRVRYD